MDRVECSARRIANSRPFNGLQQDIHAIVANRVHRDRPRAMRGGYVE